MAHVDIPLKDGIEIAGSGSTTKAVRMRSPTVNDMLVADKSKGSDAEKEIAIFANLCSLTPDEIGKMSMRDYALIRKAWLDFLE